MNLSGLPVGWLGDPPENRRRSGYVLARPWEARGLSRCVRMNDVGVDLARARASTAWGLASARLANDHGLPFIQRRLPDHGRAGAGLSVELSTLLVQQGLPGGKLLPPGLQAVCLFTLEQLLLLEREPW